MQIDINEPLVWTTKGNLPTKDLTSYPVWEETEDYTKFTYVYEHNGEVVRIDSHVRSKKGALIAGEQAGG